MYFYLWISFTKCLLSVMPEAKTSNRLKENPTSTLLLWLFRAASNIYAQLTSVLPYAKKFF